MSHLLDIINGKASFARMADTESAWHGLGQIITPNMSVEEMQETSQVNYEVAKTANFHICPTTGEMIQANDFAMVRKEIGDHKTQFTGLKFANVSEQYQPVQPHTIVKFFHDLAKKYDLQIDTIGALKGGRKIWAMAKMGDSFTLAGGDTVDQYCLLSTSYDKTMATRIGFTSVRVVCNNTLQYAIGKDGKSFISVPHSTAFDAEKVKMDLGIVANGWSNFSQIANELSNVKLSDKQALRWLVDIFEEKDFEIDKLSTRKTNVIKSVYDKYKGQGIGSSLVSADGTAWGLVNAITEHYDHDYGRNDENRFSASQFGIGATAKDAALEYITETLELTS